MSEYLIEGNTMTTWANHARRISGVTEELNAAEIAEIISRTQGECLDEIIEVDIANNEVPQLCLIQEDTMNAVSNHVKRISGTTEELDAVEIAEIISRTQGTVKNTGEYEVRVLLYDGLSIKDGTYDTGEVFALPKESNLNYSYTRLITQPDGSLEWTTIVTFDRWVSTSPMSKGFVTVEDMPIDIGALYKPVDDCFIVEVEITEENTTIAFNMQIFPGTVINWGDGTVEVYRDEMIMSITHTYTSIGNYLVKISRANDTSENRLIIRFSGNDVTYKAIKGIIVPKWLSMSTDGLVGDIFNGLISLEYLIFEEGVTFRNDAQYNKLNSLKHITFPNSATVPPSVHEGALKSVVLPYGVTEIPGNCFFNMSNLTKVIVPENVTSIGNGAFAGCSNLTFISLPTTITSLGDEAFVECTKLSEISNLDNVTSVGNMLFGYSGFSSNIDTITKLILPSATYIGYGAFQTLTNLKILILGANSVCELGVDPSNIYTLFSSYGNKYGVVPTYFDGIYVPDNLVESYKSHEQWSTYADYIKPISQYVEE